MFQKQCFECACRVVFLTASAVITSCVSLLVMLLILVFFFGVLSNLSFLTADLLCVRDKVMDGD